ncbi:hypothetical protein [Deinococcus sp.]|uniref:hypothetical protein n=1 Tax=Deinococcus sp. TaxID=47478 RepID=UPI0025F70707|nr:hypothetical protein [Deinococcus sp.]
MNLTLRGLLLLGSLFLVTSSSGTLAAAIQATTVQATTAQVKTPASVKQSAAEQIIQMRARTLLTEFYAVKLGRLWAAFTPDVKAQYGDLAGFTEYRKTGVEQFGAQKELVAEKTFMQSGATYYVRSATFEKAPQIIWALSMGFDQLGRVSAFGITLERDRSEDQTAIALP